MEKNVISQRVFILFIFILLTYLVVILFEKDINNFDDLESILLFRHFRLHM
ncbi:hypothetical protein NON08_08865 [Cetobacterium somerae]|uniref:hypothetical protein n=1 Tax=Cetobacterium sp. NK01 TaxID=2993530 RepID=UPI0021167E04|nr:hypothetical protein [Cetobacterium sp. NK01]MCQ8212628.1 hypothetical protein [Cetobacterium sp. NK01]